jgi:hypothetical protein
MSSGSRQAIPGVKPLNGTQITATTTAAALAASTAPPARFAMQGIIVQSIAANTQKVYVGGSGVTATTGIELAAGGSVTLPVFDPRDIYVISASGSQEVHYLIV